MEYDCYSVVHIQIYHMYIYRSSNNKYRKRMASIDNLTLHTACSLKPANLHALVDVSTLLKTNTEFRILKKKR